MIVREYRVQDRIQRNDSTVLHVVADLPANATSRGQHASTFGNNLGLLIQVQTEIKSPLVLLANIIGRGRDDQLYCVIGNLPQQFQAITMMNHRTASWVIL